MRTPSPHLHLKSGVFNALKRLLLTSGQSPILIMEEKQLTEKESLALINQMIHEGKNYFQESGAGPIAGGIGVVISSLLAYAVAKGASFPFNPFYLVIPVWRSISFENIMKPLNRFPPSATGASHAI